MYGFNQLSVIARKGVGRAFSSLIICSSMKGIFHLTVLVAAGEHLEVRSLKVGEEVHGHLHLQWVRLVIQWHCLGDLSP